MSAPTLTECSASELARMIRAGETSSVEVVGAHIELAERVNPAINAVVAPRFDEARAEAEAADQQVAAAAKGEELPPLLGVPCTVKESIAVAGMPNSAGLVARRDHRAPTTAPAAQRLFDAGAILLGLTNTSELCMWFETENRLYGRTSNPYDATRISGGSSGGEGAVIGSGASPFGIGSDVGGSIRLPAFCCGVFGHKPSPGLVPLTGAWPDAHGETTRLLANGPLARRAEDLMPLLEILGGPDGIDETTVDYELGDPGSVELDGMRVVISEAAFMRPIGRDMLAARERAAGALAAAGARIETVHMRSMVRSFEHYLNSLSDGGAASVAEILLAEGADPFTVTSLLRRGGPHTVATRILVVLERLASVAPQGMARRSIEAGREFAAEMAETIGEGVLLHPPTQAVAPRHGRTIGRAWWMHPMSVFNVGGVPVTQVPLGLDRHRLPLGVQVAGRPGNDHVTIAVARHLERVFGGWMPPDS